MKTGWFPLVPWGLAIVVVSFVGLLVFDLEALPFALLCGAGAVSALWGAATGVLTARRGRPFCDDTPHVVVDGSWATVVVCVGATIALSGGLAFGAAFVGLGAVVAAAGAGGLVREARAERRLRRGGTAA